MNFLSFSEQRAASLVDVIKNVSAKEMLHIFERKESEF
jgi:hypothetical protein